RSRGDCRDQRPHRGYARRLDPRHAYAQRGDPASHPFARPGTAVETGTQGKGLRGSLRGRVGAFFGEPGLLNETFGVRQQPDRATITFFTRIAQTGACTPTLTTTCA